MTEYSVNDFSPLNRALEHEHALAMQEIQDQRAKNFSIYAKWGAILGVSFGFAALLTLWGASLFMDKPAPEIIEKEVVVKDVQTIYVNQPPTAVNNTLKSARDTITSVQEAETPVETGSKAVYNFTLFRSEPADLRGMQDIVVGMRYDSSDKDYPEFQYCYVEIPKEGSNTSISLAQKTGRNTPIETELTVSQASDNGIRFVDLQNVQSRCIFLN